MIIPMRKYVFMIFHREYHDFVEGLQNVGVVHIVQKETEVTYKTKDKHKKLDQLETAIRFLTKREIVPSNQGNDEDGEAILEDILLKQKKLEDLCSSLEETRKEIDKIKHWGHYSVQLIERLKEKNIDVLFFSSTKNKFSELAESDYALEVISEQGNSVYFILIKTGDEEIKLDAEEVDIPKISLTELTEKIAEINAEINNINKTFDNYAACCIPKLVQTKTNIINSLEIKSVHLSTATEAENKLMILEGWAPQTKRASLENFLKQSEASYFTERAIPGDKIPVLLKNNRFSKLFEPIGSLFSLPEYSELDLTVFFAPFFMMFFGFCLGDAGYGLLFIVGAAIYKRFAKQYIRPYLSLLQFLGLATVVFGTISGTIFGVNLMEANLGWTSKFKHLFLDPNKMFNLALVLGGVQIIFALFIRAANQKKQYGFIYSLSTWGWLIVLLGSLAYFGLTTAQVFPENKTILYIILSIGGFLILFFSDPKINVFARIGKGAWDVYSTVTGIFGDLLSYIRLFALGLSSAILGFVINDIALQILGFSKFIGPIFFIVFLLLGHTLNILISSLGSFVHPMRLTFVEFYKNAGFTGGGEEYKPFAKKVNASDDVKETNNTTK